MNKQFRHPSRDVFYFFIGGVLFTNYIDYYYEIYNSTSTPTS